MRKEVAIFALPNSVSSHNYLYTDGISDVVLVCCILSQAWMQWQCMCWVAQMGGAKGHDLLGFKP